jgi:hypothetical protein
MKCHRLFVLAALVLAATIACERRPGAGGSATSTGDILVGMYGSLTGDGASFGQSSVEGAQLAVEELNNAGGLLGGRKIRLLVEDDQSKPDEASNAVQKLITQNKVIAVLGEVASRRSLAAGPVCQKYQTPMISPASTNERVTAIGDYIFRVCFIDPFQGEVLAKFAYNDLKARKVAVLKDVQQDYSVGLTDAIQKTFTALGGQVLDPVSYSSGDADFKAILTQVRAQKPDAMFVTGYYPEAAIIVRQARVVAHGPVRQPLDQDPDDRANRHGAHRDGNRAKNRRIGVHVERVGDVVARERTKHVHVAVREIDQAQHAVHHRVAERDQRVDRAEREAVDQLLEDGFHGQPGFTVVL